MNAWTVGPNGSTRARSASGSPSVSSSYTSSFLSRPPCFGGRRCGRRFSTGVLLRSRPRFRGIRFHPRQRACLVLVLRDRQDTLAGRLEFAPCYRCVAGRLREESCLEELASGHTSNPLISRHRGGAMGSYKV